MFFPNLYSRDEKLKFPTAVTEYILIHFPHMINNILDMYVAMYKPINKILKGSIINSSFFMWLGRIKIDFCDIDSS